MTDFIDHQSRRYFLIIDLEATCWEGRNDRQGENEIIEIGYALVSDSNEHVAHGGWFVRPVRNPLLSDFCKKLTSIRQEDVDGALQFPDVMEKFASAIRETTGCSLSECIFVSWGNYDRNQFQKDCEYHKITYPFGRHVNLKEEFKKKFHIKHAGVGKALKKLEMSFEGTPHRGQDDAINIARIFVKEFGPAIVLDKV